MKVPRQHWSPRTHLRVELSRFPTTKIVHGYTLHKGKRRTTIATMKETNRTKTWEKIEAIKIVRSYSHLITMQNLIRTLLCSKMQ